MGLITFINLAEAPHLLIASTSAEELAYVVRTLKSTAKELNVPIIALLQLSRTALKAKNRRPELKGI